MRKKLICYFSCPKKNNFLYFISRTIFNSLPSLIQSNKLLMNKSRARINFTQKKMRKNFFEFLLILFSSFSSCCCTQPVNTVEETVMRSQTVNDFHCFFVFFLNVAESEIKSLKLRPILFPKKLRKERM